MQNRQITVLDLNGCKYVWDLHERIRITFDFPEGYGRNWDAFWDFLNMEVSEDLTNVEIRGLTSLPADLKEFGEKMVEIMQENKEYYEKKNREHPDYGYQFDYRIID